MSRFQRDYHAMHDTPRFFRRSKNGFMTRHWHCCRNCHKWPSSNYDETTHEPHNRHDICKECIRLLEQGRCRSDSGW